MGIDTLGARNGKAQRWINGTLAIRRKIEAVEGNRIVLEVPLMDSYDATYLGDHGATLTGVLVTAQLAEDGVDDLRIQAPARAVALGQDPEFDGIQLDDATDPWLSNVILLETTNSVNIGRNAGRITVIDTRVTQYIPVITAAKPFDFPSAVHKYGLIDALAPVTTRSTSPPRQNSRARSWCCTAALPATATSRRISAGLAACWWTTARFPMVGSTGWTGARWAQDTVGPSAGRSATAAKR